MVVLLSYSGMAQDDDFVQEPASLNKAIMFKAMGYLNLLGGGYGSVLGIEKGFLKRHSIGVKSVNNYFTPHSEMVKDRYGVEHELGDYSAVHQNFWVVEYKYYFYVTDYFEKGIYVSLNSFFGKSTEKRDRDYIHPFYYQKEKYLFIGPALGYTFNIGSEHWYFDTQLSYLTGNKTVFTDYAASNSSDTTTQFNSEKWRFEFMVVFKLE